MRGVITVITFTEEILNGKLQFLCSVAAALNGKDVDMLLPTSLTKLWIYQVPLLSVGTLHRSGIKFLIGDFTGAPITNFVPVWEFQILNQSNIQRISSQS